jgi:NAD+ kinase
MPDPFLPHRPVVAVHPKMPEALKEANAVVDFFKDHGMDAFSGSLYDEELRRRVKHGDFDLLVALGGDGTMLRAAHLCAPARIPILGINLGRLGFLIQVEHKDYKRMLNHLLKGETWIEDRMMLRVEHLRAGESKSVAYALNEAAVSRGQILRPVRLSVNVDGRLLTTYVADGLLAATPTGSTAYALAAGGPILPPELRNILIVPIAAHLSVDRAVVLAEGASVSILIQNDNVILSVDGQEAVGLAENDHVDVGAAEYAAQFVRFGDPGYFYRNLTAHMHQNSI